MLPWLPDFPPQAFPTTIPSFTSLDPTLHSQQQPLHWNCSTIPKLQFPATAPSGDLHSCMAYVWIWHTYHLILIPFRLPQISCFTLSLKCFSFDSDNGPAVGIGLLLQFPHPKKAGPVLLTLLFSPLVPSSYQVLCGSIYSFPLARYFCPFSAGVLHALLCLKVYS